MRRKHPRTLLVALTPIVLSAVVTGCTCGGPPVTVGELVTESESVAPDGARSVTVEVDLNIGELTIAGGAEGLMEAEFEYNVAAWKPEIEYRVDNGRGQLVVRQPPHDGRSVPDDAENTWTIALNDDVPMTLTLDVGIGNSRLELGSLSLSDLDVDAGIGNVTVDLTGSWSDDVHVDVDGGIGNVDLKLPPDVGVRLERDVGLGSIEIEGFHRKGDVFVNDAFGQTDVTIDLNIDAGIGRIRVGPPSMGMASI